MQDIIISGLCKAYGEHVVLKDFSCCFEAGSASCLMAPSGYGKTTLLRLIMGLEQADAGSIAGADGLRINPLFQEDLLCENLNAIANLQLVNVQLDRKAAKNALLDTGLEDCAGQKVHRFSGGMKRRVALMRALCASGDLLLLDEPFKGLDEDNRRRMIACIEKYRNGRTMILVSHDERDALALQAQIIRMEQKNRI